MHRMVRLCAWSLSLWALCAGPAFPQPAPEPTPAGSAMEQDTLSTLEGLVRVRTGLKTDIEGINRQIKGAQSEAQKQALAQHRDKLEADLETTTRNFEDLAAGVDISSLRAKKEQPFNFQAELFSLLRPAIDEMKDMTAGMRQKSELKEKVAYYQQRIPLIEQALANTDRLLAQIKDQNLRQALTETAERWSKRRAFMQSELRTAQLQLDKLAAAETSLAEASQSYVRTFFQKRGLYLSEVLLAILVIVLVSHGSYAALQRHVPGFRRQHRSFRIRLVQLGHRVLTVLLIILGPMIVFYLVGDWVLFSLGVLVLLGLAWTLRLGLPRYWHQIQIFLNIGSVREGERILMEGLPWLVKELNFYCSLINPVAEIGQRVPIASLVDLKSRPCGPDEPWFPCRKGDWVILSNGLRGKVTGISQELVQLVQRGGAQVTYRTSDFLAASPVNLATNFRLKETLSISYGLQKDATGPIPDLLQACLQHRAAREGYADRMLSLRVELAQAGSSSLDLVVIADFAGELGDLYNRLRRAIQRWCVDACTEHGWQIPFPQLTLSGTLAPVET